MSSNDSGLNGTVVAVLASIGVPLAAAGLVTSVIAMNVSNNNKQAVSQLETTAATAQQSVVRELADEIATQASGQAEATLRSVAAQEVEALQSEMNAKIAEQSDQIALLEAALADATATIQAVTPPSEGRDVMSFGAYSADVYQELAGIGVNWQETKGTDFVIEAIERSAPVLTAPVEDAQAMIEEEASVSLGDPDAGKRKFSQCSSCHSVNEGGRNGIGPNLWGVYEAELASKEGFSYSNALREFGGSWTAEQLDGYLANPRGYIRGTKMGFAGLRNEEDRANVVAYLATLQ